MHAMIENAQLAVETPQVQAMIRELSKYGLGVFVPHMHREGAAFAPLPKGLVQLERDLKVSFVEADDPAILESIPVGWEWDGVRARVCASRYCQHDY